MTLKKKAIQTGAHLNFLLCRAVIRPSSSCRTDLAGWGGMAEGEGNNHADNVLHTEPLVKPCFTFTSVPQRWVSLLLAPSKRKLGSKSKVTFPKSSFGTQPRLLEPWSSQNWTRMSSKWDRIYSCCYCSKYTGGDKEKTTLAKVTEYVRDKAGTRSQFSHPWPFEALSFNHAAPRISGKDIKRCGAYLFRPAVPSLFSDEHF